MSTTAAAGSEATRDRRHTMRRVAWFVLVPVAVALLLGNAFGLLPGQLVQLSTWGAAEGLATCAQQQGAVVVARCPTIGLPVGQVSFEALVPRTMAYWLGLLPVLTPYGGYQLTGLIFLATGAAGCLALARDLTGQHWPGLVVALTYLASPVVLYEHGLPPVFLGAFILPAALWLLLRLVDVGGNLLWRLGALVTGAIIGLVVVNVSGYAFLYLLGLTAVLGLGRAIMPPSRSRLRDVARVGLVVVAAGASGLVHKRFYWPDAAVTVDTPLGFFRQSSVDVIQLALPASGNHLWGPFGAPWGEWAVMTNVNPHFIGWSAVTLAMVGLLSLARQRPGAALGLATAVAVTAVLSLGPSLRVDDPWPSDEITTGSRWDMPAEAVQFDFPWAAAYTREPVKLARVVRRWTIPLELTLDLAAAAGAAALVTRANRRRTQVLVLTLTAAFVVESISGALPRRLDAYNGRLAQAHAFDAEVLVPLDASLPDDTRSLFLPMGNDYLAAVVGPRANLQLLNVGGDKNLILIHAAQDQLVREVQRAHWRQAPLLEPVRELFARDIIDALILGDFSLRRASYRWPPDEAEASQLQEQHAAAVASLRDSGCEAERFPRGWVVTC